MSLADKWAEIIYRVATTRRRLRIALTPLGITFWFGLGVLLVFASLWLDRLLPARLPFVLIVNISVSLLFLVAGGLLCLWSVYGFFRARGSPVPLNPPRKLVTSGAYSRIRNPMLLGWFMIMFGVGVLLNSISLMFVFTPLFIYLNVLYLKTVEEREMEKKFGKEYLAYKKSVPMFVPRSGRK